MLVQNQGIFMSTKISVVIHTFNCENILRDCLERVKDFDEIVICDMYSDDKTLDIAPFLIRHVQPAGQHYGDPAQKPLCPVPGDIQPVLSGCDPFRKTERDGSAVHT